MTAYTWLVILLVAAALMFRGNQKRSTQFMIIAFLLLFIVMGLRDVNAFGSDASGTHGSYPIIFRREGNTAWGAIGGKSLKNYNIGFNYLTKLIYVLTEGNYQAFVTIISLFVMISYSRFILKYAPSPIQSVLCFLGLLYYPFLFDALKQGIAMAILLFAFDGIMEKKPIKFIILTVLAAAFHFPALVFLPAYWIGRMRIGRNYLLLLAVLLVLTYAFRDQLITLMLRAYGEGDSGVTMEGIRFLRNKVLIMIALAVFAVFIRPPEREFSLYNSLLMFLGVAIIFQTFCGYNNIFERLADYYFHTSIILIPLIFEKRGKTRSQGNLVQNEKLLDYAAIVVCAFAIWRFLTTVNNSYVYMPYRFLWQR